MAYGDTLVVAFSEVCILREATVAFLTLLWHFPREFSPSGEPVGSRHALCADFSGLTIIDKIQQRGCDLCQRDWLLPSCAV